jgi:hypothetical protein
MFSKDNVRKATANSEKMLDRRQTGYSAVRLEGEPHARCRIAQRPRQSSVGRPQHVASSVTAKYLRSDSNAISSPLFRLPPELRNAIYKYALGGYVVDICCASSQRNMPSDLPRSAHDTIPPATPSFALTTLPENLGL